MAVVNVGVRDHVDQLARLQPGHLGQHVNQHSILHHIPAVGGEHVLGLRWWRMALRVFPVTLKVME